MSMSDHLDKLAGKICHGYISRFPRRKIWITEQFGKRVSCIASDGKELYTKPYKIKLSGNISAFIEDKEKLSQRDVRETSQLLQHLFTSIIKQGTKS